LAGVAVDDAGRVYVADPPHGRMVRFKEESFNVYVLDCAFADGLASPSGAAFSELDGGTLWVTDTDTDTLQKYAIERRSRVVVHVYDPAAPPPEARLRSHPSSSSLIALRGGRFRCRLAAVAASA
jgi:sugar lactone lactonase YvrE